MNNASQAESSDPETWVAHRDFKRMASAIGFIEENFRAQPSLSEIAAHAGLSEFHFNRLFRRWAGLTPKQYLAHVTLRAAHGSLTTGPGVLEAAYDVGLSGAGRLHDLTVTLEALTPGEIRRQGAGTTIHYGFSESPFGTAFIAATARGVCRLALLDVDLATGNVADDPAALTEIAHLTLAWPGAVLVRNDAHAGLTAQRIWCANPGTTRPIVLAVSGTNFQIQVWRALLALTGTTTYGQLAERLGMPQAARAIGNAVGANPVAWIIPCHRVLRGDGSLGGYRWGVERKRAVLAWERAHAAVPLQ